MEVRYTIGDAISTTIVFRPSWFFSKLVQPQCRRVMGGILGTHEDNVLKTAFFTVNFAFSEVFHSYGEKCTPISPEVGSLATIHCPNGVWKNISHSTEFKARTPTRKSLRIWTAMNVGSNRDKQVVKSVDVPS